MPGNFAERLSAKFLAGEIYLASMRITSTNRIARIGNPPFTSLESASLPLRGLLPLAS